MKITREQLEEYMREELIIREYPLNLINQIASNLADMYFNGYRDGCVYQQQLHEDQTANIKKLFESNVISRMQ